MLFSSVFKAIFLFFFKIVNSKLSCCWKTYHLTSSPKFVNTNEVVAILTAFSSEFIYLILFSRIFSTNLRIFLDIVLKTMILIKMIKEFQNFTRLFMKMQENYILIKFNLEFSVNNLKNSNIVFIFRWCKKIIIK